MGNSLPMKSVSISLGNGQHFWSTFRVLIIANNYRKGPHIAEFTNIVKKPTQFHEF
jgi:hypothetical protein